MNYILVSKFNYFEILSELYTPKSIDIINLTTKTFLLKIIKLRNSLNAETQNKILNEKTVDKISNPIPFDQKLFTSKTYFN